MAWVRQTISICLLFIFTNRTADARACISREQMNRRGKKVEAAVSDLLKSEVHLKDLDSHSDNQTCSSFKLQTASEKLHSRSLSPWRYRVDRDDNRIPQRITVAECLCKRCIINQYESDDYNSVPVTVSLEVLKRETCPGNPDRYLIRKEVLEIPVGCTCVVPKVTHTVSHT